jgi:hypothetical protein
MRYRSNFNKLLEELVEYDWFFDIYAKSESELSSDTDLLILDDEDEDDRDEYDTPVYPQSKGYGFLMSIADLRSVIENLENACDDITLEKTIDAVMYYYDNDSFLF